MSAIREGTAIYKTPVTVEALMRNFTGRYFRDVTGDTPSEEARRGDLQATEVYQEPEGRRDSWSLEEDNGNRVLIRHHHLPRLALFNPQRAMSTCPVPLEELTGKRRTTVRMLQGRGEAAIIDDTVDVQRNLQDRWTGETRFELKPQDVSTKRVRRENPKGTKRKSQAELEEEVHDTPNYESTELTKVLRSKGPNVLDGAPISTSSSSMACLVPGCTKPGGHPGPHQDVDGIPFVTDGEGPIPIPEETSASSSSSSSTSSEELLPDQDDQGDDQAQDGGDTFIAVEIDTTADDFVWLANSKNRKKGDVWLCKKMSEKGKEVEWTHLPLSEKKEFDMAMAKEISNVVISRALRDLTPEENQKLNKRKVMQMRWVLTRKGDGSAKARLVVLGFQAHNITEVETASPTMSKVGRNLLLTIAACLKLRIKSGDATSAFLQTGISLEEEELTVWAPPELASMFGAEAGDPRALRVREAFYGLCHAPRKWFERCVKTMKDTGWRQLHGDRCVYVLLADDDKEAIGVAGLHVDDFLIGGREKNEKFLRIEKALLDAFRWGKWEEENFEFAGCHIRQAADYSIVLDQQKYTEKWLEEIP